MYRYESRPQFWFMDHNFIQHCRFAMITFGVLCVGSASPEILLHGEVSSQQWYPDILNFLVVSAKRLCVLAHFDLFQILISLPWPSVDIISSHGELQVSPTITYTSNMTSFKCLRIFSGPGLGQQWSLLYTPAGAYVTPHYKCLPRMSHAGGPLTSRRWIYFETQGN